MRILIFIFFVSISAGCDETDPIVQTEDVSVDTDADMLEPDMAEDAGGGVFVEVPEAEPNGFNDPATPFTVGQTVGGQISIGDESDFDLFSTTLTAGSVFEITFAELGDGFNDGAVALIYNESGERTWILETATGGLSRQVFVPADDTYILAIYDKRAEGEEPHGGIGHEYIVKTRIAEVTPVQVEASEDVSGDQSDGTIDIFEISTDDNLAVVAETFAQRAPVSGGLDTKLWIYDGAVKTTLAENDDIGSDDSILDSKTTFRSKPGGKYWIVVDHYEHTGDARFDLTLSSVDDAFDAPRVLLIDQPETGIINVGTPFDSDYFVISVNPGETIRVEVSASGGLNPTFDIILPTVFGQFTIARAESEEGAAAAEFTHNAESPDPTDYYVVINDVRNVPREGDPINVGDTEFMYGVLATFTTWAPTVITLPFIDQVRTNLGETEFFEVVVPPGQILGVEASVSLGESTLSFLNPGNNASAFEIPNAFVNFEAQPQTVRFGLRDSYFRSYQAIPSIRMFDPSAIDFIDFAESEPNNTVGTSREVTPPVRVIGVSDGTGTTSLAPDFFSFDLAADQTVVIWTSLGTNAATDDADNELELHAPSGEIVVFNDDYFGQTASFFSGFVYTAPTAGTYSVEVNPFCRSVDSCSGVGDYSLNIWTP